MTAAPSFDNAAPDPELYLSPSKQDLMLVALNSNKPVTTPAYKTYPPLTPKSASNTGSRSNDTAQKVNGASALTGNLHQSPLQNTPRSASLGNVGLDDSPFPDYDLDDGNLDWEFNGEEMIRSLPGTSADDDADGDLHDKRKNPNDDAEDDEGGGKRREGDEKTSKKPGRKPLTSEPTSKRKAQNRAAQRAFRERKERHLKELETKVEGLEKASESTNHENGLLRAQVERLQTELREYRKRLSVTNSLANASPPQPVGQPMSAKTNWDISNNFQFEFPVFGMQNPSKVSSSNSDSNKRSSSGMMSQSDFYSGLLFRENPSPDARAATTSAPRRIPSQSTTEQVNNNATDDRHFSPTSPLGISRSASADYNSYSPQSNQRSNPGSVGSGRTNTISRQDTTESTSPSASSVSQNGLNSSCGTTPESSADSPKQRQTSEAVLNIHSEIGRPKQFEGENAFCDLLQTVCGDKTNLIPHMLSQSNAKSASTSLPTSESLFSGIDWMASQNGGAFDPILYGEYRDPNETFVSTDFNGFFNDAFSPVDFASPVNPTLEPTLPMKQDLMQHVEDAQAGKEPEFVPGEAPKQYLTCNMLWDRVQRSQKVQSGEADMDDLCAQLKAKAKCSGQGAVVDQNDVDAILGPAPDKQNGFFRMFSR